MSLLSPIAWRRSRLIFPLEMKVEEAAQVLTTTSSAGRGGILIIETTATADEITHHVITDEPKHGFVNQTLRSGLRGLRTEPEALDRPAFTHGLEFKLSSSERPLRADAQAASSTAVFSALHDLKDDEAVRLQWTLRPARRVRPVQKAPGGKPVQSSTVERLLFPPNHPADETREALAKRSQPLVQAVGRLAVRAATRPRRRQLIGRVLGALGSNNRPGVGVRYRMVWSPLAADRLNHRRLPWLHWPVLINSMELVALVGWPLASGPVKGLERGHASTLPVPSAVPASGRVLADANDGSGRRAIALSAKDRLQHLHVVGPTGSGKSYLLANLVLQDIAAGDGVVVIDPKGDLVEDILARADSASHQRIIVLDPTDEIRPIGVNLLDHSSNTRELLVESVVSVFHELYRAFWGPRSDDILRAALNTLVSATADYSIAEIPTLLTQPAFRRHVISQLPRRDPVLASFWTWFEGLSDAERNQAVSPLLNKLRAFTMRPRLRNIVGQTGGLAMSDVLERRQVLLVTLNSGLIGRDASQLLGSLLVAQLWQATLQRAGKPQHQRRPVMVTIDEVQDFLRLPVDVGDMLAQARGLGIGMTLAHQHLGQLPADMKSAVLANARSRAMFRIGYDDAHTLSKDLTPYLSASDLEGLRAYEVALRLSVGSQIQPPTTGLTRDLSPAHSGQSRTLRQHSAKTWGTPIAEIERAMAARQQAAGLRSVGRESSHASDGSSVQPSRIGRAAS